MAQPAHLICHLSIRPADEPSALLGSTQPLKPAVGAACIGARCAAYVTFRDEKGNYHPVGCGLTSVNATLMQAIQPALEILIAWHNDRVKGQAVPPADVNGNPIPQ
jgi:hypothetical protein